MPQKQGQTQDQAIMSRPRRGKGDDASIEKDIATSDLTPKATPKKKLNPSNDILDGQSTLDKHLKPAENVNEERVDQFEATLKNVWDKLDKLASQEYIEKKFKEMVSEKFLSSKLKDLEREVKAHVKTELEIFNEQVVELKGRVGKAEKSVEMLRNDMSDMQTCLEKMKEENGKVKRENAKMKEQLKQRESKLQAQAEEINSLGQYTRANSIRIYGIEESEAKESSMETARKVAKLVNDKLYLKITTADIDVAHRMGRYKPDANRPIICKFISRFTKLDVISARRNLKGSPVVIREDLTIKNIKLLESTSAHTNIKAAWSDRGKVIGLLKNNRKIVVDRNTDLDEFGDLEVSNPP